MTAPINKVLSGEITVFGSNFSQEERKVAMHITLKHLSEEYKADGRTTQWITKANNFVAFIASNFTMLETLAIMNKAVFSPYYLPLSSKDMPAHQSLFGRYDVIEYLTSDNISTLYNNDIKDLF